MLLAHTKVLCEKSVSGCGTGLSAKEYILSVEFKGTFTGTSEYGPGSILGLLPATKLAFDNCNFKLSGMPLVAMCVAPLNLCVSVFRIRLKRAQIQNHGEKSMKVKHLLAATGLAFALNQSAVACDSAGTFAIQMTTLASEVTGTTFHFGGEYCCNGDYCLANGGGNFQTTITEGWTSSDVEFPEGMTLNFQFRTGAIAYNAELGKDQLIAELKPIGTTKNFLLALGGKKMLNDWNMVTTIPIGDIHGVTIPAPWDPTVPFIRLTVTER